MTRKQEIGFIIAGLLGIACTIVFFVLLSECKFIEAFLTVAITIILARIDDAITNYNRLNGEKSKDAVNGMSWW